MAKRSLSQFYTFYLHLADPAQFKDFLLYCCAQPSLGSVVECFMDALVMHRRDVASVSFNILSVFFFILD